MDNLMLRGRIVQKFGTIKNIVEPMGLSYTTILAKLSGAGDGWTQAEIWKLCGLLDIESKNIPKYFFAQKVK